MIWKNVPIKGYEELYQISNYGDVYSLRRNKCLKPKISKGGYLRVGLSTHGKVKMIPIHRLVALAYIPNPQNKNTVNHINEIKTDNRVDNLEWATTKEQNAHGTRLQRARAHTNYKTRIIDYESVSKKHNYSKQSMCNRKKCNVYKNGVLIGTFKTQKEAGESVGVSAGRVSECVRKRKSCKGYVFSEN